MSIIKSIKAQLGLSNTPANNFTLDASADNGTLKLARGNAGATTQDILTVDAAGNINAPVSIQKAGSVLQALSDFSGSNVSLAVSGYQKLPSGLIIQWGLYTTAGTTNSAAISYPIAFPNNVLNVVATHESSVSGSIYAVATNTQTASSFKLIASGGSGGTYVRWIAIGY